MSTLSSRSSSKSNPQWQKIDSPTFRLGKSSSQVSSAPSGPISGYSSVQNQGALMSLPSSFPSLSTLPDATQTRFSPRRLRSSASLEPSSPSLPVSDHEFTLMVGDLVEDNLSKSRDSNLKPRSQSSSSLAKRSPKQTSSLNLDYDEQISSLPSASALTQEASPPRERPLSRKSSRLEPPKAPAPKQVAATTAQPSLAHMTTTAIPVREVAKEKPKPKPVLNRGTSSVTTMTRTNVALRKAHHYTPVKADGTGVVVHDSSPLAPFELKRKAAPARPNPVPTATPTPVNPPASAANGASKQQTTTEPKNAKRTAAAKTARHKPIMSDSMDVDFEGSQPLPGSSTRSTRASRRGTSTTIPLRELMINGLMNVGDQLEYDDYWAPVKRDGWLEAFNQHFTSAEDWIQAVLVDSGESPEDAEAFTADGAQWTTKTSIWRDGADPRKLSDCLAILRGETPEPTATTKKRKQPATRAPMEDATDELPPPPKRSRKAPVEDTVPEPAPQPAPANDTEPQPKPKSRKKPLPKPAESSDSDTESVSELPALEPPSRKPTRSTSSSIRKLPPSLAPSSVVVSESEPAAPYTPPKKTQGRRKLPISPADAKRAAASRAVPPESSARVTVDDSTRKEPESEQMDQESEPRTPSKAKKAVRSVKTTGFGGSHAARPTNVQKSSHHGIEEDLDSPPVILSSGLSSVMTKSLNAVVNKLGGRVERTFTDEVTHLVIGVDEHGLAARTFKYLEAMIRGIYIVASDWLVESLAVRRYLKTVDFIVQGDSHHLGGPRRACAHLLSRKRATHSLLFEGLTICVHGAFQDASKLHADQLVHLLELGGAQVQHTGGSTGLSPQDAFDDLSDVLIIGEAQDSDELLSLSLLTTCPPVNSLWILDSISEMKLIDKTPYSLVDAEATQEPPNSLAF